MLDVLNTKTVEDLSKEYKETAEVNAILKQVKMSAKELFLKVIQNNLSWKGNWSVDHKFAVLVRVGERDRYTKFFKQVKEQDDYINSLFCKYHASSEEVLVEVWVYEKKPEHQHDVYVN